jgi:serine phosphatase RsbU (regulator of sigma subunit)
MTPADVPLGLFPDHCAADYVIALPPEVLVLLYTDGITEHDRDPVRGEEELLEAAQIVYGRPELNLADAIASRVFETGRGHDDAAAIAFRMISRCPKDSRLAK